MSDSFINLGFAPGSLASLAKLEGFDAWLAAHLLIAMGESIDVLRTEAIYQMLSTFGRPSASVHSAETSWRRTVSSPYRAILTNTSRHGLRLNYGFSRMTDSLGRYFTAWPKAAPDGYHWAEHTIENASPGVYDIFHREVSAAMDEVSI